MVAPVRLTALRPPCSNVRLSSGASRFLPAGRWRHPAIAGREQYLILICQEGYQSSLAAATLQRLGLVNATDLDGGFAAWAAAGLPVTR